jgi:hypothetical protein
LDAEKVADDAKKKTQAELLCSTEEDDADSEEKKSARRNGAKRQLDLVDEASDDKFGKEADGHSTKRSRINTSTVGTEKGSPEDIHQKHKSSKDDKEKSPTADTNIDHLSEKRGIDESNNTSLTPTDKADVSQHNLELSRNAEQKNDFIESEQNETNETAKCSQELTCELSDEITMKSHDASRNAVSISEEANLASQHSETLTNLLTQAPSSGKVIDAVEQTVPSFGEQKKDGTEVVHIPNDSPVEVDDELEKGSDSPFTPVVDAMGREPSATEPTVGVTSAPIGVIESKIASEDTRKEEASEPQISDSSKFSGDASGETLHKSSPDPEVEQSSNPEIESTASKKTMDSATEAKSQLPDKLNSDYIQRDTVKANHNEAGQSGEKPVQLSKTSADESDSGVTNYAPKASPDNLSTKPGASSHQPPNSLPSGGTVAGTTFENPAASPELRQDTSGALIDELPEGINKELVDNDGGPEVSRSNIEYADSKKKLVESVGDATGTDVTTSPPICDAETEISRSGDLTAQLAGDDKSSHGDTGLRLTSTNGGEPERDKHNMQSLPLSWETKSDNAKTPPNQVDSIVEDSTDVMKAMDINKEVEDKNRCATASKDAVAMNHPSRETAENSQVDLAPEPLVSAAEEAASIVLNLSPHTFTHHTISGTNEQPDDQEEENEITWRVAEEVTSASPEGKRISWVKLSNSSAKLAGPKRTTVFHGLDENKVNRVKMLLYTAGSQVHRGRGFERVFADYWDAVCLRLSDRLSSHTSERCEQAMTAFLKSKKLKRLHNRFIIGEYWCICFNVH